MFSIYSNGNKANPSTKKYLADTLADRDDIPVENLTPGTTVFVIEKSETYMLNHSKQWIKIIVSGGSSSPDPEGTLFLDCGSATENV